MSSKYSLVAAVALTLTALAGPASAQEWKLGVSMVSNPGGGVRVVQVFANSPAERLGLVAGDLILTVDGNFVNDPLLLRDYIFTDGRTNVRLVFQHSGGFTEADADFAVVIAAPPVAAVPIVGYSGPGAKGYSSIKKAPAATLKIKSVQKRAVADPRLKAGLLKPLLKTSAKPLSKPLAKPAYKPAPNPLLRP